LVLQGLGRVAVPSPLLDRPAGDEAGEEAGRLVPYWTHRILSRARTLEPAARICLRLGERVDGSGALGLTARDLGRAERLAIAALVHAEAEASGHRPEVALARACRPADAASVLAAAGRPVKPPPRPFGLTGREAAVLELIAVGRTNTEIGLLLEISPKTVGSHVAAIFDKLGVSTRAAAGFVALRDDLVRPSR
jgi:DNA-binding CsgD family transcriptional regulator